MDASISFFSVYHCARSGVGRLRWSIGSRISAAPAPSHSIAQARKKRRRRPLATFLMPQRNLA
jgi:hypothetical protein